LADLEKFSLPPSNKILRTNEHSNILLPGSGLSRLLLELTLRGHNVTGNEISYHQLMGSQFILNGNVLGANSWTIYPWVAQFCNVVSRTDQLRSFTMPDVDPATATAEARARGDPIGQMGMASGDFCISFNDAESANTFSSVITAYFIDTSPNLFRYIQTIHNCLQPGGLWINIGPLLWHFDARSMSPPPNEAANNGSNNVRSQETYQDTGIAEPGSFEMTYDEVLALIAQSGFEILHHEVLPAGFDNDHGEGKTVGDPGLYLQDPRSMMQMRYRCGHFVARKTS
jgi:carnosine N-methyltransferase